MAARPAAAVAARCAPKGPSHLVEAPMHASLAHGPEHLYLRGLQIAKVRKVPVTRGSPVSHVSTALGWMANSSAAMLAYMCAYLI
jgi:hypothetical protein